MSIKVNSNFQISCPLPIDNRQYLNKQDMLNINDNIMPDVYFAVCIDDGKFYLYNKTNTPNVDTGKFIACNMKDSYTKGEVDALLASINHQITSFPVASIDYVGKIYQYIGATTNDYINGYYYTCKQFDIYQYNLATVDGTTTGTYYNNDGTVLIHCQMIM